MDYVLYVLAFLWAFWAMYVLVMTEIWVRHTSSASSHQVRHRWRGLLSPMALSFVAPLFERPL